MKPRYSTVLVQGKSIESTVSGRDRFKCHENITTALKLGNFLIVGSPDIHIELTLELYSCKIWILICGKSHCVVCN